MRDQCAIIPQLANTPWAEHSQPFGGKSEAASAGSNPTHLRDFGD
jgi:hypothetical protein